MGRIEESYKQPLLVFRIGEREATPCGNHLHLTQALKKARAREEERKIRLSLYSWLKRPGLAPRVRMKRHDFLVVVFNRLKEGLSTKARDCCFYVASIKPGAKNFDSYKKRDY